MTILSRWSISLTLSPFTLTILSSFSDLAPNKSIGLLTKLRLKHLRTCCWFRGRARQRIFGCFDGHIRPRGDRTQSLHFHCARLRNRNLGTNLLFINFRYNCACYVFGQWNVDLKHIIPEPIVFPSRRTRVTWALGTRLPINKSLKWV